MKPVAFIISLILAVSIKSFGQAKVTVPLNNNSSLRPVKVSTAQVVYQGKQSLQVKDTAKGITDEVKFVKLTDVLFQNGVIEVELAGKPLNNAAESARGFVGIAFRIAENDSTFECLYLRPTNGRAEDQVRRNHSVQYISYPALPWQKSRQLTPGKYESYADLITGAWTKIRIEVEGSRAKLYVHESGQPVLIVNDLKLGGEQRGAIGLWIGSGTEAYFTNLRITHSASNQR